MAQDVGFQAGSSLSEEPAPEDLLAAALKERELLLKKRPDLQKFQDEIDRLMQNAASFEDRMTILGFMLQAKLHELSHHMSHLLTILRRIYP